jgi:hypothetical protein
MAPPRNFDCEATGNLCTDGRCKQGLCALDLSGPAQPSLAHMFQKTQPGLNDIAKPMFQRPMPLTYGLPAEFNFNVFDAREVTFKKLEERIRLRIQLSFAFLCGICGIFIPRTADNGAGSLFELVFLAFSWG